MLSVELNTEHPLLHGPAAASPLDPFARQVAFNWEKDYQDAGCWPAFWLGKQVTNGPSAKMQSSGNSHPQQLWGGRSSDLGKRLMSVRPSMC